MDNIPQNCLYISKGDKEIYILGTAHVLKESKNEVESLIGTVDPDSVCVELCDSRFQSLKDKDRWKNLDIVKVIRQGKGFLLFANMILSSFQKRIGLDLESAPGDEMVTAFTIAEEKGKKVVLADRDINVTLKRAWGLSGFIGKLRILETLLESMFTDEKIGSGEISDLMKGDNMINEMMEVFAAKLPMVKLALIDERDQYIANKILTAEGGKIVAVVGKGHQKGIQKLINEGFVYNKEIEKVPGPGIISKILPWAICVLILALIVFGFLKGSKTGWEMLWIWVIVSGTSTALVSLISLPHPLTVISSFIAAPIKIFIPTISAGMIMAPLEAVLKKPMVKDFEGLNNDIMTVKGFYRNRLTRVLLVFVTATIGAIIGHTIAIIWIARLLAIK